jgi:hypothetical protein
MTIDESSGDDSRGISRSWQRASSPGSGSMPLVMITTGIGSRVISSKRSSRLAAGSVCR